MWICGREELELSKEFSALQVIDFIAPLMGIPFCAPALRHFKAAASHPSFAGRTEQYGGQLFSSHSKLAL